MKGICSDILRNMLPEGLRVFSKNLVYKENVHLQNVR